MDAGERVLNLNKRRKDENKSPGQWLAWSSLLVATAMLGIIFVLVFTKLASMGNKSGSITTTKRADKSFGNIFSPPSPVREDRGQLLNSLIDKQVFLTETIVQKVLSDRVFLVGKGEGEPSLLVFLEPSGSKQASAPNKFSPKTGQKLALSGIIQKLPDSETIRTKWQINDLSQIEASAKDGLYLKAEEAVEVGHENDGGIKANLFN